MAKKRWSNPHTKHVPSPKFDAIGKPGKHAHSERRRKTAMRRQRGGQR